MGLFSKKISKDKIVEALEGFFTANRLSLLQGIADLSEEGTKISNEQDHEIMILALFSIYCSSYAVFGSSQEGNYIETKFGENVLQKFIFTKEEREQFKNRFSSRYSEYREVFHPENKDMSIQMGQIFCNHFFGKEGDGSHAKLMIFVGMAFMKQIIEVKKFLDEILSRYEVI